MPLLHPLYWAAYPNARWEASYQSWVRTRFYLHLDLLWSALDLISSLVILYRLTTWSAPPSYLLLTLLDLVATSLIPLLALRAPKPYLLSRIPLLSLLRIAKSWWTAELNRKFFRPSKIHMRIMKLLITGPASYCFSSTFGWQLPIESQIVTQAVSIWIAMLSVPDICDGSFRSVPSTAFVKWCYQWIDYCNSMVLSALTGFNVGVHTLSADPCKVVQRWVMICWGLLLPTLLLALLEFWFFRGSFLRQAVVEQQSGPREVEKAVTGLKTKMVVVVVLLGWLVSLTWQVVLAADGTAKLQLPEGVDAGWNW